MDYSYITQPAPIESAFSLLFGACFFLFVVVVLFLLAQYILFGIGLYKTAARQKCAHPWLAWIPFARNYLFGLTGDRLRQKQNRTSARRIIFLILSILRTLSLWISVILMIQSSVTFISELLSYPSLLQLDEEYITYLFSSIAPELTAAFVLLVLFVAISVCNFVLMMVNYNTLYRENNQKSAVTFLVLAIIGSLFGLFFLPPILLLVSLRKSPSQKGQLGSQASLV